MRRHGATDARYGVADGVRRGGEAFGLRVHEVHSKVQPGEQSERYVDVLRQTIEQFRPDMIWWDELFLSGISSEPQYRGAIAALLEDLYGGLGRCCDLINHCHPAVLDRGTAAERAGVFCCPAPAAIAPPRPHGRRRQGVGRSATTPATSIGPGC